MNIEDYNAKFRGLWSELALYISPKAFCVEDRKEQGKLLEDQQVFDFLGGLNMEYEAIWAQVLRHNPLPPMRTKLALLQGEESRRRVMLKREDVPYETSALCK